MKLLDRIQALDASRRLEVVNKYIPALLVHKNYDSDGSDKKIIIGHIHSNVVEAIRKIIDGKCDKNPDKSVFLLPPLHTHQNPHSSLPLSNRVEESSSLIRNQFFGFLVDKTPQKNSLTEVIAARSDVLDKFTDTLIECRIISKRHSDMYPITDYRNSGDDILATINRNSAPYLGITSIGVHLLCFVRDDQHAYDVGNGSSCRNVSLWLAQRAANKSHNALRWDPTVAGGQPASLGLFENLVKEAGEEAGINPELVIQKAVSTGCLSQMTCKSDGTCMKPSLYYTWDMQVDRKTFVPQPADAEVLIFELCPAKELEYEVRHGNRLRPAMILVVTDFLIRHGIITPDNEPDYVEILLAMKRKRLIFECIA